MGYQWYLAYCRPREEQRAKIHLCNQGVECYYPIITTKKVVRGKSTVKEEPLFPRYMFIYADLELFSPVKLRSTRGISHMIGHREKWSTVPKELIYELMRHEDCDALRSQFDHLPKCGDAVMITEGSVKGIEAIYQEPDGETRGILLVKMLNQQIPTPFENSAFTVIKKTG